MARRRQTPQTQAAARVVDPAAAAALFRALPAVDQLLREPTLVAAALPPALATTLAREAVADARTAILVGTLDSAAAVAAAVQRALAASTAVVSGQQLRPLYNGIGVLLMTNAGRAPLGTEAIAAIVETAAGACTLELDLDSGERGSRQALLRPLLRWLGDAEDGLVVNNGAAALMLALHALAAGRPVVVSRGELVEIGGSFRVPDVMTAAGVRLVEVGTTNRTHARDFADAVAQLRDEGTPAALLLQIHRSNFAQVGFVATPTVAELAAIAHEAGIPLVCDLGSGALAGMSAMGLRDEPEIAASLAAGADLVTASGDKLLGGPQAGLLLGRAPLIARCGKAPMARALRPCKLTLAALDATLRAHLRGDLDQIPVWRAIRRTEASLDALGAALVATTAEAWAAAASEAGAGRGPDGADSGRWPRGHATIEACEAAVGGGAQAGASLPSRALVLHLPLGRAPAFAAALRAQPAPWLARVRGDALWLDLRSLGCGVADADLVAAWSAALHTVLHSIL